MRSSHAPGRGTHPRARAGRGSCIVARMATRPSAVSCLSHLARGISSTVSISGQDGIRAFSLLRARSSLYVSEQWRPATGRGEILPAVRNPRFRFRNARAGSAHPWTHAETFSAPQTFGRGRRLEAISSFRLMPARSRSNPGWETNGSTSVKTVRPG